MCVFVKVKKKKNIKGDGHLFFKELGHVSCLIAELIGGANKQFPSGSNQFETKP